MQKLMQATGQSGGFEPKVPGVALRVLFAFNWIESGLPQASEGDRQSQYAAIKLTNFVIRTDEWRWARNATE